MDSHAKLELDRGGGGGGDDLDHAGDEAAVATGGGGGAGEQRGSGCGGDVTPGRLAVGEESRLPLEDNPFVSISPPASNEEGFSLGQRGQAESGGEGGKGSSGASFVTERPLESEGGGMVQKSSDYSPVKETNSESKTDNKVSEDTECDSERRAEKESVSETDLKVSIAKHVKHEVKGDNYVVYGITTETTRKSMYDKSTYEVWRRYRDFEWLRDHMEKSHPTLIIPPLPGKQLTRYFDHMSPLFITERKKALERFLWRLSQHPYFTFDKNLKLFLTEESDDFKAHAVESSSGQRFLDLVSSSVKQAATALKLKEADPEFARQAKYFSQLGEKMSLIERIANRLHTDREELTGVMQDFSVSMQKWAGVEKWSGTETPELGNSIKSMAHCIENCGKAVKHLNEQNGYSMLASSKEYQLFCASGVSAIKRRDALQLEKEQMTEERERKKKSHEEAVTSQKMQRISKVARELEKSGLAAEKALDELTQANEKLRVDTEKWHEAKDREMASLMKKFADNHIEFHKKCFEEWEQAIKVLRNLDLNAAAGHSQERLSESGGGAGEHDSSTASSTEAQVLLEGGSQNNEDRGSSANS